MSKHIIVIGGGPAGIEAAIASAAAGGKVTLVSEGPVGGRSGWHSLLPSKVWLSAADKVGLLAASPFEERRDPPAPDAILSHLVRVKKQWNGRQSKHLEASGVSIANGVASFETAGRLTVKDSEGRSSSLSGDAFILATGSVPFFPPNLKPDGTRIIAPRFMSGLGELPSRVVVIGAGATGTEVVYLFNRMGMEVTWVVDKQGVLPQFAPDAGERIGEILVRRGVRLVQVERADQIEYDGEEVAVILSDGKREKADLAFVAIGRRPDLQRLNLEAAGFSLTDPEWPETGPFCQTGIPGIYAVGDVAGPPMIANRAMAMARVAGRHAAGADVAPFNPDSVIAAVYTEPQVAQVGVVTSGDDVIQSTRIPYDAAMKAHLLSDTDGFMDLSYNQSEVVTGGVALGPHAGDILAPVALAVHMQVKLDDMAALFAAHPTMGELAFAAARKAKEDL